MPDDYLINGVSLAGLAWGIEKWEGLHDAPDLRGDDIVVPSAHGTLDPHGIPGVARRRYGPGQITFNMWVLGVDPDTGLRPGDDVPAILARLDTLQRLFNARQLVIDHPRADGDRRAIARLAAPIRPVIDPTSTLFGRFTAQCTIPGAFWVDTADTTVATDVGGVASGTTIDLSALACSAPITDALLRFGPGNNPQLTQGGTYFTWGGVIASGRQLLANAGAWQVQAGTGTAWSPDPALVSYGPGPSWWELDPTADPLQVTLSHTGGSPMFFSITARRKHLTS